MAFPYPLVTTGWLADHIGEPDLKIIDGSWRMPSADVLAHEDFAARHIPGAVFFDIDDIADRRTDLPHMLPNTDAFAAAAGRMGINASDRVVVYDDAGLFSAARVWWTFRAMGHEAVSVLDGGLPKWIAEGNPTTNERTHPKTVLYRAAANAAPAARSAADIRGAIRDGGVRIIDARPTGRFEGRAPEPRAGLRSGAMPGALNIPANNILNEDKTLKPTEELERLFSKHGVALDDSVITTCGSGVTAAMLSLALEHIGHRRHALYDGSWAEWGREENNPDAFPVVSGPMNTGE